MRARIISLLIILSVAVLPRPGIAQNVHLPAPDPAQGDGGVSAFYTWAGELPGAPGQMLRTEPLDPAIGLGMASAQFRILYSSTNGVDGETPVAVSGAFFIPRGPVPAGGWPLVAWAHGTTGIADTCAPSWMPRSPRDAAYLDTWLGQGYAIVATDYQGLGTPGPHPYLQVRPEAYSVLDSIRAVLKGFPDIANKIVIIGQSQGGQAAFATAGTAPIYAPDLNIRGTVATGVPFIGPAPPARPQQSSDADPTVAYTFYIGIMTQQNHPSNDADLVTPRALPLFEEARTTCVGALFRAVAQAGLNRGNSLTAAFGTAYSTVLPNLIYSTIRLPTPLFVGTGTLDHDVSPAGQLSLVRNACVQGTIVEAHLYSGRNHGETVNASLKDSVPFVRKVLAGEPIRPICEPVEE